MDNTISYIRIIEQYYHSQKIQPLIIDTFFGYLEPYIILFCTILCRSHSQYG